MGWVKLDDGFPEHPKVEAAGEKAAWLYVCGLAYCSRTLSDGFIPGSRVKFLTKQAGAQKLADTLVRVRLWDRVEDGYVIHDYGKHQRSRAQVEQAREQNNLRAQRHRAKLREVK